MDSTPLRSVCKEDWGAAGAAAMGADNSDRIAAAAGAAGAFCADTDQAETRTAGKPCGTKDAGAKPGVKDKTGARPASGAAPEIGAKIRPIGAPWAGAAALITAANASGPGESSAMQATSTAANARLMVFRMVIIV
jgi:hypothetical protein